MSQLSITPYSPGLQTLWDATVDASKNGTFLLRRGFMDYHADRFRDASMLIMQGTRPLALFAASVHDGGLIKAHGGLTYGGLILTPEIRAAQTIDALKMVTEEYVRRFGSREMIYRAIPHIYHTMPAEEDLYALSQMPSPARLMRRDVSSALEFDAPVPLTTNRRRAVAKALKAGITVVPSADLATFHHMLSENLAAAHGAKPVHSLDELKLLVTRFPQEIKLLAAVDHDGTMLGATLLFLTRTTVHTQYICSTERGRQLGALDLLFTYLISDPAAACLRRGRRYLDFGRSTEPTDGAPLNSGLIHQKEGFGARAICYDTYLLPL